MLLFILAPVVLLQVVAGASPVSHNSRPDASLLSLGERPKVHQSGEDPLVGEDRRSVHQLPPSVREKQGSGRAGGRFEHQEADLRLRYGCRVPVRLEDGQESGQERQKCDSSEKGLWLILSGCPATTAKPTGCGKLCYTGCPAKNVAGNKNTAVNLYWDSLDQFTSMLCRTLYASLRAQL
jgi:hypothetical protein